MTQNKQELKENWKWYLIALILILLSSILAGIKIGYNKGFDDGYNDGEELGKFFSKVETFCSIKGIVLDHIKNSSTIADINNYIERCVESLYTNTFTSESLNITALTCDEPGTKCSMELKQR